MERNYFFVIIFIFLLGFYIAGLSFIKYVLAFMLMAALFQFETSAVYVVIILLTIPFFVYFKLDAFSEMLAQTAFIYIAGSVFNYLLRDKRYFRVLVPAFGGKICALVNFVYFFYVVVFGVLLQIGIVAR